MPASGFNDVSSPVISLHQIRQRQARCTRYAAALSSAAGVKYVVVRRGLNSCFRRLRSADDTRPLLMLEHLHNSSKSTCEMRCSQFSHFLETIMHLTLRDTCLWSNVVKSVVHSFEPISHLLHVKNFTACKKEIQPISYVRNAKWSTNNANCLYIVHFRQQNVIRTYTYTQFLLLHIFRFCDISYCQMWWKNVLHAYASFCSVLQGSSFRSCTTVIRHVHYFYQYSHFISFP